MLLRYRYKDNNSAESLVSADMTKEKELLRIARDNIRANVYIKMNNNILSKFKNIL